MKPVETLQGLLNRAAVLEKTSLKDVETGLRFVDRRERATCHSWTNIRDASVEVAEALHRIGIRPGDRVALIYPTCVELIHGLFGAFWAGAIPVPLYPPVRLGRLEEYHRRTATMLQVAGARLALTDTRVAKLLGVTCEKASLDLGFLTLPRLFSSSKQDSDLETSSNLEMYSGTSEETALVQFSSGTTVDPKPVALSHRAILAQVRALNGFWPDPADPDSEKGRHSGVTWLPLYHDMGLIGCVFPALERPSILTLIGPEIFVAKPSIWLRTLSRYKATISVAPNFAYGLCVDKIQDRELEGMDLSSWKVALNGAEPVAPEILRAFQSRFAQWGFQPEALTPVYGLSEATLAVTFSSLETPFRSERFHRGSLSAGWARLDPHGRELIAVGRPLPGTKIRIQRDDGEDETLQVFDSTNLESSEETAPIGRIQAQGPSIMSGYLGRPEATKEVLSSDGWLDTGDLGFLWRGELFVVGRAKDVLILRGRNYNPVDVEQAVDGLPNLRTGCTVAVSYQPEGAARESLMLFVEYRKGTTSMELEKLVSGCEEAVLKSCALKLDRVMALVPGTLPRTSSGKLRRSETLRRYLAGELQAPENMGWMRLTGKWVQSHRAYQRARSSENGQ